VATAELPSEIIAHHWHQESLHIFSHVTHVLAIPAKRAQPVDCTETVRSYDVVDIEASNKS
jgi:hypothetical protein